MRKTTITTELEGVMLATTEASALIQIDVLSDWDFMHE